MKELMWLVSGGFLAGHRTMLIAWAALVLFVWNTVVGWAVGDYGFMVMVNMMGENIYQLLVGAGLLADKAHVDNK